MHIQYPYQIDGRGQTGGAGYQAHVRQMIEQVLFTMPGERVNRPDFGCGLMQLVFDGNSEELAATTQFLIQGAMQQFLSDLVRVEDVTVEAQDAKLLITMQYVVLPDQTRREDTFELRGGAGATI